jgi:hypothetical protein
MLRILAVAALCALTLAGCATQAHQQIAALKRGENQQGRIVLMPLNVELFELSAAGIPEPKGEWTEQASRHVIAAVRAEKAARNINMVEYDESRAPPSERDDLAQLVKLHGAVGNSILIHQYIENLALPTKQGKFDWSLGPEVRSLRNAFNADYALFVFVHDQYSSAGRVALQVALALLGVGVPGGAQVGFASLVDLETGNVVWFNRLLRGVGDLRTEPAALETVQTLLAGLPQ